jgi:hypothetical protein
VGQFVSGELVKTSFPLAGDRTGHPFYRLSFLFGVFHDGNDLCGRNLLLGINLWKIVSVPLGHPPLGTILSDWNIGVRVRSRYSLSICESFPESFPWQSKLSFDAPRASGGGTPGQKRLISVKAKWMPDSQSCILQGQGLVVNRG